MSVKVSLEDSYRRSSHNGAFQSFRPVKALMLYSQRRNSIMENESFDSKINLPSTSWSSNKSQNIELKLTCKETYLKDTSAWSDMQDEVEESVGETKYYPPKKRFLEKAEMEADQTDTIESSTSILPTRTQSPNDNDYLGVSTKCLKETILQYRNAFEAEFERPNTKASEFLHRTFGDVTKNNNLDAEKNMNLCVQNARNQKTEPYYRSGYKKFTLRRIEEDSNDSNIIETTTVIEQLPHNLSDQNEVNELRGKRNRACKGVRYQQFMNDTLSKRQNKKMGPKKLLNTTSTAVKPKKGKKCQIKVENSHAIEINSLPTQSRRETRNSIKAAALHKHENSDKIIEDNKRKFTSEVVCKDQDSISIMVVPKKRFRTNENDNRCKAIEEPKRLPTSSPISSEASSSRLSSPESTCSNSSTHVHYKKRVSRTFVESQISVTSPTSSDSNFNLQTLADVALRGIPF